MNVPHSPARRDYEAMAREVRDGLAAEATPWQRMQAVVDAIWRRLGNDHGGVSWVGFYLPVDDRTELVLGPRRDKPACSPIGLHGVCGRAFTTQQPAVVRDVAALGDRYIACDPRDRSEAVVPVTDCQGRCVAVLDLDSHDVGAFDQGDLDGLRRVLAAADLGPSS
ncbi:MAG TPA: GAF domain-containing protein [Phycisphaerae bacterium]|nr:GAF domain-containing protein [Phycisphaerae bacterium]HOI55853.1 GAF domain-containing protein [Phycisphaerae bacterium]